MVCWFYWQYGAFSYLNLAINIILLIQKKKGNTIKLTLNEPKFLNSLNSNEEDIIKKHKRFFINGLNNKIPCIFSEKEIKENLNKAVKEVENKTATLYTKEEIDKQIKARL